MCKTLVSPIHVAVRKAENCWKRGKSLLDTPQFPKRLSFGVSSQVGPSKT